MADDGARPAEELVIRVGTFRVPEDNPGVSAELRALAKPDWGRCRWVGRRLIDDPQGAEIVVVSLWPDRDDMDREVASGQIRLSDSLRRAAEGARTEIYTCRVYGAWQRQVEPCLVRIFRGKVVEGDPDAFDSSAAGRYLANFEGNPALRLHRGGSRARRRGDPGDALDQLGRDRQCHAAAISARFSRSGSQAGPSRAPRSTTK